MPMFKDCWQHSQQTETRVYVTGSCAQATRSNCHQWLTARAFSRWHKVSAQLPGSEAKWGLCLLPSSYERRCSTNIAAGCGQRAHANATPSALEAALASAWETESWLASTYLGVRENYFYYRLPDKDEEEESQLPLPAYSVAVFKTALVAVASVS